MTPRRRLFAHFRALGSTVSQSFVSAEFKGDRNAASKNGAKLEANQDIQTLVAELKEINTPEQIRAEILRIKASLNDKKAAKRNQALQEITIQREKANARENVPKSPPAPVSVHDIRTLEYCVALVIRESAKIADEVTKLDGDSLVLAAALNTHRAASAAQVEWLDRLREADSYAVSQSRSESQKNAGTFDVQAAITRLEGLK